MMIAAPSRGPCALRHADADADAADADADADAHRSCNTHIAPTACHYALLLSRYACYTALCAERMRV